jgi:hypothetical protein
MLFDQVLTAFQGILKHCSQVRTNSFSLCDLSNNNKKFSIVAGGTARISSKL